MKSLTVIFAMSVSYIVALIGETQVGEPLQALVKNYEASPEPATDIINAIIKIVVPIITGVITASIKEMLAKNKERKRERKEKEKK